ncbi:Uncharacterised protein at_DN0614 [Pycnogonum litorale]
MIPLDWMSLSIESFAPSVRIPNDGILAGTCNYNYIVAASLSNSCDDVLFSSTPPIVFASGQIAETTVNFNFMTTIVRTVDGRGSMPAHLHQDYTLEMYRNS